MPYLVICGFTVIAHGYPRLTFDFDLAIERSRQAEWLECVAALGYAVHHDGGSFLQLSSPRHGWPLDFMLFTDGTFAKLSAGSVERDVSGVKIRVPSVQNLIALKVHALNHTRTRRFLKDFQDVIELVLRTKLIWRGRTSGTSSPAIEPPSFTKKSAVPASPTAGGDALDGLDFPVAPDFESVLPAASLEVVYLACEQMLATALAIPGELERRRSEGIADEFVM